MVAKVKEEEDDGGVIEIPDNDATQSESDDETSAPPRASIGKRKVEIASDDKVQWSDDDDDGSYERLKKGKRKRVSGAKLANRAKKRRGRPRKKAQDVGNEGREDQDDAYDQAEVPDYLRTRRKQFDKNRETLREAGLLLPPDYSNIHFSEDNRLSELEERPKFDERSGIKPCRPYEDIELEYSGGLIPASIAQYLRDYQIVGVKFLHRLFVYQKGGILGDDMGLGKTVQVAAFLTAAFGKTGDMRDSKRMRAMREEPGAWYPRILIVCPGSLIQNWKNELNRWGWWTIDVFHGAGKEDAVQTARAGRNEVMITTYTTYKNHRSLLNTVKWDAVVADECHVLKERSSETTRAMNEVNSLCRIGLTGTAIQNKYEELWTLLNWTNPGHFATLPEWNQGISLPLTRGQSHDATLAELSIARKTAKKLVMNLLPGFFLRRMKTLIAHQLPKKSDKVVFCPLSDIQREAYQNFINSDLVQCLRDISEECECDSGSKRGWCCGKTLDDGRSWREVVFPAVITLQKISNHVTLLVPSSSDLPDKQKSELKTLEFCLPDQWSTLYKNRESMVNLANPEFCGKWKVLKKLLRFWHENGDKVLVFSHSVKLLRILQYLFTNTSYDISYLDGSLKYEERQDAVDNFNSDPNKFVFLISTKAGGVGLNIASANKVVIFDPHWNPSYDLQAQDRAYRIGQTRDVDVFRLISAGTIDEIVYARQIYKQQQANIGYNASSERRYFKGVQQDPTRRGEIFGLTNLFNYRDNQIVLRDIVKTNIAEAKAGINLVDVDIDKVLKEEDGLGMIKHEEGNTDDGGMSQLVSILTAEDQKALLDSKKAAVPKSDAIQAILVSAGVEYTHENSEVIGTSKVEEQLSRRAEMAADSDTNMGETSALFADSQADEFGDGDGRVAYVYNPPADAMKRQFCSMAKEFGFASATDFALAVEGMTAEQRRNCLDTFYRQREARTLELLNAGSRGVKRERAVLKKDEDMDRDRDKVKKDEYEEQPGLAKDELDGMKGHGLKTEEIKVMAEHVESRSALKQIFLVDDDDDDEL
jgi:DNA excision repair protein ERCC-6-like 2